ncbi:MAG: hypothetical protein GY755_18055 [Chloroflexi bacterium]|nr:hypothetical protein [Chloroflexota bacterium]
MNRKESPFFVTILSAVALILVVFNAIRFVTALLKWDLLLSLMPDPGPLYITITGALWALGWLGVYLGIFFAQRWSGTAFFVLSFLYTSYYWLDRLLFQPYTERSNAPFSLILSLLFFVSTTIILALPKSREYFYDEYEVETTPKREL